MNIKILWCFLLSLCPFLHVIGETVESNVDGDVLDINAPREVTLVNPNNFPLHVYYVPASGQPTFLLVIHPFGESVLTTYLGHKFHVKSDPNSQDIHDTFAISRGVRVIHLKHDRVQTSFEIGKTKRQREHPLKVNLNGPRTTAVAAKFRSLSSRVVDVWYDDGRDGINQGTLRPGQETTTNAYEGHVFYFTEQKNKSNRIHTLTIRPDQYLYLVRDDPQHTVSQEVISRTLAEEAFNERYYNRTGIQWRHHFDVNGPRAPPVLHMWPANEIGQVHEVTSNQGYWICDGPAATCQSKDPIKFELEVVSREPKVFVFENFLNDLEIESILKIAASRVKHSTVGSHDGGGVRSSDTRTSRNTWVARDTNSITDTLFRRAADVLRIDEKLLTSAKNAEDLQVVHYVHGQKYDSHHDWGVSGYMESRYLTMLLYLTDQLDQNAGGETSFPKAKEAGTAGFKVRPKKGCAVLFYNLLEDGNGDDLALHAALPVHRGEKWLANFWVWDPKRK